MLPWKAEQEVDVRHLLLFFASCGSLAYGQTVPSQKPDFHISRRPEIPRSPVLPKTLEASSMKLVAAPDFAGLGTPVCDDDGNVFYHVGRIANYDDSTILRFSSSGDQYQVFKLPPDVAGSGIFGAFNVTPSGKLWISVFNQNGENLVYGFDSKGEVTSRVRYEVPEYLQPRLLAAFETDFFLLKGFFATAAGPKLANKSYAAILEPSGQVVRELSLNLPDVDSKSERKSLPEGGIAVGSDGNAYLLLPDRVVVISQSGELVRQLSFEKPDREARATNVYVSGGLVAVDLSRSRKNAIDTTILVLDANTGDTVGYYEPSKELGNNLICFSRAQGFTFLGPFERDKLKLQTAALR